MSKAAKDKRWAIAPPASAESSALSGEFSLGTHAELGEAVFPELGGRRVPARRFQVERPTRRTFSSGISFTREIEAADSERPTEIPPYSGERLVASSEALLVASGFEETGLANPASSIPDLIVPDLIVPDEPFSDLLSDTIPAPPWLDNEGVGGSGSEEK